MYGCGPRTVRTVQGLMLISSECHVMVRAWTMGSWIWDVGLGAEVLM